MKSLVNYLSEEQAVACVGKGWESLVRKVYNARAAIGTPVGILKVTEKWGGLRVYTDYYDSELEKTIVQVGEESLIICEECGSSASLVQKGTLYRTRCSDHKADWIPVEN